MLKRGALEGLSGSCFGFLGVVGTSGHAVETEGVKSKNRMAVKLEER